MSGSFVINNKNTNKLVMQSQGNFRITPMNITQDKALLLTYCNIIDHKNRGKIII